MRILDIKKLILVSLVCCITIHQADAKVVADKETKTKLQNTVFNNIDDEISWFSNIIQQKRLFGKRNGYSHNIAVAPYAIDKYNNQMGGILAYVPSCPKNRIFLMGAKRSDGRNLKNNEPDNGGNLYKTNDYSHTEVNL